MDLFEKEQNTKSLDMPIPGQSLTTRPGQARWEQPPDMTEISEVADWFWERLTSEDMFRDTMRMLDAGAPINEIVVHLVSMGAMHGKYNTDMAILITPIVTTQLAYLAKMAGVEYQIYKKVDPGIDPSNLEKIFKRKTGISTELFTATEVAPEEDMGLLKPKGKK